MAGDDDPPTEELLAIQSQRERDELARADGAADPDEERAHLRRAEKAAYLRSKLDEQAESLDQ